MGTFILSFNLLWIVFQFQSPKRQEMPDQFLERTVQNWDQQAEEYVQAVHGCSHCNTKSYYNLSGLFRYPLKLALP